MTCEVNDWQITEKGKNTRPVQAATARPSVPTMSLVGASISSIIMLSRVKELRFSVLDLSELKERRLGVVAVAVTDYQDNSHSDGGGR